MVLRGVKSFGRSGQHVWLTTPLIQCPRVKEGTEKRTGRNRQGDPELLLLCSFKG